MRKCTSMALPMILQGKEKNAECETWSQVGVPKFSANVAKRTERTQIGQFRVTFCFDFDEKSLILGARAALAPVWGRVPKMASKKTISAREALPILKTFFEFFVTFRRLIFHAFLR